VTFPGLEFDRRWCLCRRPYLAVGGELLTSMLDLRRDDASGVFVAPLQMKASDGILLIDDFGRQLMSPRDLLNRWIVPLDRRVDFLSLGGGKIDIPFELLVVFSTNLEPQELGDEAFLRRVPNKIRIGGVDAEGFDAIFRLTAAAADMECEPGTAARFRELCLRHSPDLRQCFPRDICDVIRALALYEGRKPLGHPRRPRASRRLFLRRGFPPPGPWVETDDPLDRHTGVIVESDSFGRMGNATIRYCARQMMKHQIGLIFTSALGLSDSIRRKLFEKAVEPLPRL
jgi:hypothetical protein